MNPQLLPKPSRTVFDPEEGMNGLAVGQQPLAKWVITLPDGLNLDLKSGQASFLQDNAPLWDDT